MPTKFIVYLLYSRVNKNLLKIIRNHVIMRIMQKKYLQRVLSFAAVITCTISLLLSITTHSFAARRPTPPPSTSSGPTATPTSSLGPTARPTATPTATLTPRPTATPTPTPLTTGTKLGGMNLDGYC